jgi:hypothetical protein
VDGGKREERWKKDQNYSTKGIKKEIRRERRKRQVETG